MRRLLLALPLLLAAPIVAQQAMQTPGSKNRAAVTGGVYKADPGHTLVSWQVDHLGFTPYFGLFGDITGTLRLDPANPAGASVDITIPVSKVTTASAGLTAHLLRAPQQPGGKPDFFGANPADARFVSTKVVVKDDDEAQVTGNLTLNGVTRPVTLDVGFYGAGKLPAQMGGKENVGFEAKTTLRRSDFGLGFSVPMVGDEVKLRIAAGFEKTDEAASGCGAEQASRFVRRKDTPALRAQVVKAVGHDRIRWIGPRDAVTQDMRADRLNMALNGRGVVTSARCF